MGIRPAGIRGTLLSAVLLGALLMIADFARGQARLLPPEPITNEAMASFQPAQDKEKKAQEDLFKLDLERLLQVPVAPSTPNAAPISLQQQVSSVSRQESSVAHSAAAVFVITQEMIRRSGATSIPEVLRMAPGLQVSRVDSSRWAITSRGFSERFAGKLLVQIDGRTVYNPVFSGVYWDVQDLLLQDVERIEVIRGPGATVWGANAVNGIINIITKSARETQGGLVTGGGGSFEGGFTGIRYGGKIGDDLYYRVWGKWFDRDTGFNGNPDLNGIGSTHDDWRQGRGGVRFDWLASERDTLTLQGDLYQGDSGRSDFRPLVTPVFPATPGNPFVFQNIEDEHSVGGNVLFRWTRQQGKDANWMLQAYWDHFDRHGTNNTFHIKTETFDLDFQQQFPLTCRQKLIYGLGYRLIDVSLQGSSFDNFFAVGTAARSLNTYTAFVQDEFTLVEDKLFFTAGSKFEHNAYTGFEYQPTGRLLWAPDKEHSIWGAVSRAVRTPNLLEAADGATTTLLPAPIAPPVFPQLRSNRDLNSEDLIAYEIGYRAQPSERFSWDLALFYNVYDNLIVPRAGGVVPGPVPGTFVLPLVRENGLNGETYGAELAANVKLNECWRVYGQYTFLRTHLHRAAGLPSSAENFEKLSPRSQVYVQSSWDLPRHFEFDLIGRYVETLPGFSPQVPSYITLDARLAWRPRPNLEIAVVGQNLLDSHHLETGTSLLLRNTLVEIPRGVYGMVTVRW